MPQPSFLLASLYVALGGGLGSWLRFLVGRAWTGAIGPVRATAFPWATLTVNFVGCIVMGLICGWLARVGSHGEGTRLFLAVGVMGGFTTFSAFSLEIVLMAQRGQANLGMFYAGLSVLLGIVGLVVGLSLAKGVA